MNTPRCTCGIREIYGKDRTVRRHPELCPVHGYKMHRDGEPPPRPLPLIAQEALASKPPAAAVPFFEEMARHGALETPQALSVVRAVLAHTRAHKWQGKTAKRIKAELLTAIKRYHHYSGLE